MNTATNWFASWFDSPWYHLLYQNRDEKEAEGFVARLMEKLDLPRTSTVLDLACGKGRHSKFIHSLGYTVLGVDLSERSILEAKKMETEGLRFRTGDMREPQGMEEFDLVLNLFTSFGYFEKEEDNLKVLLSIRQSLKPGGLLLLDFMNTARVLKELIRENEVEREEIIFRLRRSADNGFIVKHIDFEEQGRKHQYFERVQALHQSNFLSYFAESGMELVLLCGNYDLGPFSEEHSDRMIFLVRKS
jgi:SAM-dependent methyltransferase